MRATSWTAGQQRRNRLEHIEPIDASDIPRFGALRVIASMQPYHAYPETNLLDVWAVNVGPGRLETGPLEDAASRQSF